MRLIVDKKNNRNISYHFKNILRNTLIIFSYIVGFSCYALLFLGWTINFKEFTNIVWIAAPILGLVTGLIHMGFIYKGSLICKALVMFIIMFYVFILPLLVAIYN